jgi:hypothetical protein
MSTERWHGGGRGAPSGETRFHTRSGKLYVAVRISSHSRVSFDAWNGAQPLTLQRVRILADKEFRHPNCVQNVQQNANTPDINALVVCSFIHHLGCWNEHQQSATRAKYHLKQRLSPYHNTPRFRTECPLSVQCNEPIRNQPA